MADTIVTIHANISWRARKSDLSDRWIAVCDVLNLSMEADSLDEMHSVISETFHALFTDLLQGNELNEFLTARGWSAAGVPTNRNEKVAFDVPWELIAEGARGTERRCH